MASTGAYRKRSLQAFFALTVFCVGFAGVASFKAALLLGFWAFLIISRPIRRDAAIWVLSVTLNLLFCTCVALAHDIKLADALSQFSRIALFFVVFGLGSYIFIDAEEGLDLDSLIRGIAFCMAALKIAIVALLFSGLFVFTELQQLLGFESVALDIGLGLERLQFPSDIIIIFLLSCYVGGRNKFVDALFLLSISIIVYLSFSRFIFAGYGFALVVRSLWLRRFDTVTFVFLLSVIATVIVFADSLILRFSVEHAGSSDAIRGEEARLLVETIKDNPFFGTGLGSGVRDYARSESLPYLYELQWFALAMQMGMLGLAWMIANFSAFVATHYRNREVGFFFGIIMTTWVISAFTNPFLTTLGSAFGVCILIIRCNAAARSHRSNSRVNTAAMNVAAIPIASGPS